MSTVITNNPRILLIGLSPSLSLFIFETLISLTSLNFSTPNPTPWAQILNCNMEIFSFQEVIAVLFPCIKTKTKVNGFVKINASFLSFQGKKKLQEDYVLDIAIMSWVQVTKVPISAKDTNILNFQSFSKEMVSCIELLIICMQVIYKKEHFLKLSHT